MQRVVAFVKVAMKTLTTTLAPVLWKQSAAVWLAKRTLIRPLHLRQRVSQHRRQHQSQPPKPLRLLLLQHLLPPQKLGKITKSLPAAGINKIHLQNIVNYFESGVIFSGNNQDNFLFNRAVENMNALNIIICKGVN
jgi:hypothetical protein